MTLLGVDHSASTDVLRYLTKFCVGVSVLFTLGGSLYLIPRIVFGKYPDPFFLLYKKISRGIKTGLEETVICDRCVIRRKFKI